MVTQTTNNENFTFLSALSLSSGMDSTGESFFCESAHTHHSLRTNKRNRDERWREGEKERGKKRVPTMDTCMKGRPDGTLNCCTEGGREGRERGSHE